jgi:hypothetical protein
VLLWAFVFNGIDTSSSAGECAAEVADAAVAEAKLGASLNECSPATPALHLVHAFEPKQSATREAATCCSRGNLLDKAVAEEILGAGSEGFANRGIRSRIIVHHC